jgi:hypothetical protein
MVTTELQIRAICPVHDKDVQFGKRNLKLLLTSDDAATGAYEFHCPFGGHDPVRKSANEQVVNLLRSIGITHVVTTHDPLGPLPIRR